MSSQKYTYLELDCFGRVNSANSEDLFEVFGKWEILKRGKNEKE